MTDRPYKNIRALLAGEVLDLGGVHVRADVDEHGHPKEIQPGDLYVAERNTGPHLLTADRINSEDGWIRPRELAYSYDTHECVKVVDAN